MNSVGDNPYIPANTEPTPEAPKAGKIDRLAMTLLGFAASYILLMILNLVWYGQQLFTAQHTERLATTMCIYVCIIMAYNFVLIGGTISILRRWSYPWAFVTFCLSVIPILGPCFVIGIPIGILGVIELNKPCVKRSFRSM